MTATSNCLHCPHRARLEKAKACYRAQQAEIARLRDLLARYQSIGVRRFQESEVISLALVGTEIFYEKQTLARAVQQRDMTIQHQAYLIAALKLILAGEPQPQRQEVQP